MAFSVQKSAAGARTNAISGSVSKRSVAVRSPVAVAAQRGEGAVNMASGVVAGLAAAMLLAQPVMADIMPMYQTALVPSDSMLEELSRKSGSTDPFQKGTDLSALPGKALVSAQNEIKRAGAQSDNVPDITRSGGAANLPGVPKLNPVKNTESKNAFQGFFKKSANKLKSVANDPVGNIKSDAKALANKGSNAFKNATNDAAGDAKSSLKSNVNKGGFNLKKAANNLKDAGSNPIDRVKSVLPASAGGKPGQPSPSKTFSNPFAPLKQTGNKLKNAASTQADNIKSAVSNDPASNIKQAGNKLKDAASNQADKIKSTLGNDPISNIKQAGNQIKGAASEQGDNLKAAVSNDPISNIKSAFNDVKANLTN